MKPEYAAEVLGHCLAGAVDHRRVPGRSPDSLTSSDVAASLHAVTDRAGQLLLQVKYLGLWSDLNALERILLVRVAGVANRFGWRTKPHVLGNLIYQALDNVIPANKCPVCKGTKCIEATDTTPKIDCSVCGGTGARPSLSEKSRAKWLNISEQMYHRTYKRRLLDITYIIQSLETISLAQVARYLKN